jgi:hypothetical protein
MPWEETMKRTYLLPLIFLAFALFVSCLGAPEDDDDDDGDNERGQEVPCDIASGDLSEIGGFLSGDGCDALGLVVAGTRFLADSTSLVFRIEGQYAITNANTYYIRGAGPDPESFCYDEIKGAGAFSVSTQPAECSLYLDLDVVTVLDPEASSLCAITIYLDDFSCEQVDDDLSDDDWTDDDTSDDCSAGLGAIYNDCGLALSDAEGNQLTLEEAIAACREGDPVAACAAGCALVSTTCDEVATCFSDNCG